MTLPVCKRSFFDEVFGQNGLFETMFQSFDDSFGGVVWNQVADNQIIFEIECPGFNKDNLTVEVADGFATIKGERKLDADRHVGFKTINQRLQVGEPESVDAELKDGILYLTSTYPEKKKSKVEIKVT